MTYREQLREAKRQIVVKALEGRTISGAARYLGIHRVTLHDLMRQFSVASSGAQRVEHVSKSRRGNCSRAYV